MSGAQHTQGTEPDLHTMVTQLVSEHTHREPYRIPNELGLGLGFIAHHQTKVPGLIDQLLEPAPGGTGELSGTGAQARPAVRVEAHDTIELIATEAGAWLLQLGATVPTNAIVPQVGRRHAALASVRGSGAKRALVVLRTLHAGMSGDDRCDRVYGQRVEVTVLEPAHELGFDSKDSLLGLEGGPAPELDDPAGFDSKDSLLGDSLTRREWCCTAHHIEADVRTWWRQARIIAGWDSPTYRPFATCPVCSERRGLRINLASHSAVCVECRTVWGPESIGLLADHVRLEREGAPDDEVSTESA
ncbi:MAG TPA: hypothetical protein VGE43_04440 [Acidimicrobiales bacterium]